MRQPFAPALLLAASALIQSCGQTGPLYMPDQPPPGAQAGAADAGQGPTATTPDTTPDASPDAATDAGTGTGPTPEN
ncbi:LPS translocon maturation chaperone LptM [Parahaliea mediterranea]|uniref:LPS translocon maturation chaperone LptM n=1 Tax=Parahaliea mediterranea TaxID=651086 RepID=UPI00130099A6|nr:lipoprotein [Parahaliea mediterranea]